LKDILAAIIEYRDARGWSEYQLAEHTGLPQSTISSWYRKGITPSVASLEKICRAFGITMAQLFAEEGEAVDTTAAQARLLRAFAALDCRQQQALVEFLERL